MFFIGLIIAAAVFGMFFKTLNTVVLISICISIIILMIFSGARHSTVKISVEEVSRNNRISKVKGSIKIFISLLLIILCVCSKSELICVSVMAISGIILVIFAGINLKTYMRFLAIPMAFIFMGGFAIVLNYSNEPLDIINIAIGRGFLGISSLSQEQARLVVFKAFGAISSLYVMSLTTPMSEIIHYMKKIHIPVIIIDLMYLMYRCIFIIYEMHRIMKTSAQSRCGFSSYRLSIRTTAKIYSGLLMRSYMSASKMFDAMVSRCYDGEIKFLQNDR